MASEDVPETMLACQVVEFKKPYKIHTVQAPRPDGLGPHELLIKTAVASLCHTDFMMADGIMDGVKLPCTASHEGAGTVKAVGEKVKDFNIGDRIMCGLMKGLCEVCPACQGPENYRQYCANMGGAIGLQFHGAFAEYVVCDARTSVRLPDSVSFQKAAPLACAGCTVWRAVLQTELKKGEWLAIVGSGGGLGHLGIQFAKALGLNVVGVDARDEGLELSKGSGADLVVDARLGNEQVVKAVQSVTGGEGSQATVNVSDAASAAGTACAITKRHGLMIQVAQPETVNIPFVELIFRDIRIRGSLISSPEEAKRMVELVARHDINIRTNPVNGLKEIPKLVNLAHGGKMQGKGIVIVDSSQL